jgi:hypothetical protein
MKSLSKVIISVDGIRRTDLQQFQAPSGSKGTTLLPATRVLGFTSPVQTHRHCRPARVQVGWHRGPRPR